MRQHFSHTIARSFYSLVGIFFIIIASICVVELSSRIAAKSFVLGKLDQLEKLSTSFVVDDNGTLTNTSSKPLLSNDEIELLKIILDDLDHLDVTGAESIRQTIHAIRQRLSERSQLRSIELENQNRLARISELDKELDAIQARSLVIAHQMQDLELRALRESLQGTDSGLPGEGPVFSEINNQLQQKRIELEVNDSNANIKSEQINAERERMALLQSSIINWKPSFIAQHNIFSYLPADFVAATAMILCGGIGSIFSASRSNSFNYSKAIFNGILAGFVAFLAVKGGRFLLFVEIGPNHLNFLNPYAIAFLGIIAGLFTEKAYQLLHKLTDQFSEKITGEEKPSK